LINIKIFAVKLLNQIFTQKSLPDKPLFQSYIKTYTYRTTLIDLTSTWMHSVAHDMDWQHCRTLQQRSKNVILIIICVGGAIYILAFSFRFELIYI